MTKHFYPLTAAFNLRIRTLCRRSFSVLLSILLLNVGQLAAQQNPPRTMLQGFWWGSWHDSYPNAYYNYLARMAPRLRELGIDAIWVFPPQKAGQQEVKMQVPVGFTYPKFYESFDNYDLGDKYQKGTTATRGGTKDEYLRMIAIMHANGIDVIQDIILNHNSIGGPFMLTPLNGAKDPQAPIIDPNQPQQEIDFQQSKNYRYVSFETPAGDESAADYLSRKGRWSKNWQNFHPYLHPCPDAGQPQGAAVCQSIFGFNIHDACVYGNAFGQSSNASYNPVQGNNYMFDNMAQWLVWFKKQAGFDGVRLDAVKHIETGAVRDLIDELQNNADWANGGPNMFAVGELIDSKTNMDDWVAVQEGNRCGTFDFSLREEIRQMIIQNGFYPMNNLPGAQQVQRARTVPVVNNHDSFRPEIDPNTGKYSNFASGSPFLAAIDPTSPRLPIAYALACAVDGSPDIFIEDLFDLNQGNRYTHDPLDAGQLKTRPKIENILWARKALDFAGGAYKVRSAEAGAAYDVGSTNQDLLIIERSAKAVIGLNDNGANAQGCWIDTDFPKGTTVKDYSGNTSYTYTIPLNGPDQRIYVSVPPPGIDGMGNAVGGFVIIGPAGLDGLTFNPTQRETTHEWELAEDLGDSHPLSLGQGGKLLDWLNNERRYVARIFAEKGKPIKLEAFPEHHFCINLQIVNADESDWAVSGGSNWKDCLTTPEEGNPSNNIEILFTPQETGWFYIYLQTIHGGGQKAWVKATYTAPQEVDIFSADKPIEGKPWDPKLEKSSGVTMNSYPNPAVDGRMAINFSVNQDTYATLSIHDNYGERVATLEDAFLRQGSYTKELEVSGLRNGLYICRLQTSLGNITQILIVEN